MGSFWEKLKTIFIKKDKDNIVESLKKEELIYTGKEHNCWACAYPIHKSHRSRKLNGNHIHIKCFKKLKKLALRNGSTDGD